MPQGLPIEWHAVVLEQGCTATPPPTTTRRAFSIKSHSITHAGTRRTQENFTLQHRNTRHSSQIYAHIQRHYGGSLLLPKALFASIFVVFSHWSRGSSLYHPPLQAGDCSGVRRGATCKRCFLLQPGDCRFLLRLHVLGDASQAASSIFLLVPPPLPRDPTVFLHWVYVSPAPPHEYEEQLNK